MKHLLPLLTAVTVVALTGTIYAQTEVTLTLPSTATVADTTMETTFGGKLTIDRSEAIEVTRAIEDSMTYGKTVLVKGTIVDVCRKKGCWLVVTDGFSEMRVTFKDYAFFVPKDSDTRDVLLEGIVSAREISEDEARHYATESTTGTEAPESIHGMQRTVTMEATAVVISPEGR